MLKKEIQEEYIDLIEELEDSQRRHDRSKFELTEATKWENDSKVSLAESIIKLDKFKKEHNIK